MNVSGDGGSSGSSGGQVGTGVVGIVMVWVLVVLTIAVVSIVVLAVVVFSSKRCTHVLLNCLLIHKLHLMGSKVFHKYILIHNAVG